MKGKQIALVTGLAPVADDKVGYWLTPPDIMRALDDEFHFNYDPCPYPRPEGYDGLVEDWGTRCYVNPPFMGGLMKWAKKAVEEFKKGKLVVFIANVYRIGDVAPLLLENGAETRLMVVDWLNPKGEINRDTKSRTAALFILRPKSWPHPQMGRTRSA